MGIDIHTDCELTATKAESGPLYSWHKNHRLCCHHWCSFFLKHCKTRCKFLTKTSTGSSVCVVITFLANSVSINSTQNIWQKPTQYCQAVILQLKIKYFLKRYFMFTSKKSEVLGSDDLEQVSQQHDSAAECWKVMPEAGPFTAWGCFEHYKTGSISGHCPLSQKHSYRFSDGPTQRHLATCEVSERHWRWISPHVEDHHVEMTDPALQRVGETFQCAKVMVTACLGHPLYGLGPSHTGPLPVSRPSCLQSQTPPCILLPGMLSLPNSPWPVHFTLSHEWHSPYKPKCLVWISVLTPTGRVTSGRLLNLPVPQHPPL